ISDEARNRVTRRRAVGSAFAHRATLPKNAVHRAPGAVIDAFTQQRRIHLTWWLVDEALGVEHGEHLGALGVAQPPHRTASRPTLRAGRWTRPQPSVRRRATEPHGLASPCHRDLRGALSDELDESSSLTSSTLGSAIPRISCAFSWSSSRAFWMRSSFSIFVICRCCCSMRRSLSSLVDLRPGFFGSSPVRPSLARCARQVLRWEL